MNNTTQFYSTTIGDTVQMKKGIRTLTGIRNACGVVLHIANGLVLFRDRRVADEVKCRFIMGCDDVKLVTKWGE